MRLGECVWGGGGAVEPSTPPPVDGDLNFFYEEKIKNKLLISFDKKKTKDNLKKSSNIKK